MDYSTEEQCIGTWIDGKPLYRKCFYIPGQITNNFIFDTNISSNSNIIRISGSAEDLDKTRVTLPYVDSYGNVLCANVINRDKDKHIQIFFAGMANGVREFIIILEYTK